MGLWSGIKYALNSRLGTSTFKSLDKLIDDVQSKTNETYVQAQNANANAYEVRTKGMVKSVQRGSNVIGASWSGGEKTQDVAINAVNTSKAIIISSAFSANHNVFYGGDSTAVFVSGSTIRLTAMSFSNNDNGNIRINWQVIEFY